MNLAGLFGIIFGVAITIFSILDAAKNPKVFADVHGIVIVIGGTLTVALLSFNFKRLSNAFKIIFRKMLGKEKEDYQGAIKTIVSLAEVYRANPKSIMSSLPPNSHPFLKDAVSMVANYGFNADELDEILSNAMKGKQKRDEEEVKVWMTISRFPPAFGLLGATLGMISLLQTLGEPGAQDQIGPAMATALVATFYGLVCANLILIPFAEKLSNVAANDKVIRSILKEGVIMIVEKRHPIYIEEYLNSFLAPSLRGSNAGGGLSEKGSQRAA